MKRERDPRVTVRYTSIKEYFIMFLTLSAFNGFHMWLYNEFQKRGLLENDVRFVINFFMGYIAVSAAIVTGLGVLVRRRVWRVMRKLSDAARKITQGDFSARISSPRRRRKSDYVDVMFDDFNTMAQELQSIETLKTDFVANISHEIKTPLSVIQFYTTALRNGVMQEKERMEYTQTILEATQKLSVLITNILKLSNLENQGIIGEAKPFDLSEQIRRCALAFADLLEQKDIHFEEDLDETTVCYDENMLEIVWNNLLSNAIKFTDPGGSISIRLKVQNDSMGNFVQASVTDTGCGMDETTQKHVFDKFYQGNTSHAREGNGLGLALVKKTIDLFDGTVTVDSSPGHGSTFTVCLSGRNS